MPMQPSPSLIMSQTGPTKPPGPDLSGRRPTLDLKSEEAKLALPLTHSQNSDTANTHKKRKKKRTISADNTFTPTLTTAVSTEQWLEELQVLASVFESDMSSVQRSDGFPKCVKIALKSKETGPIYCSLVLEATWQAGYPRLSLELALRDVVGISQDEEKRLSAMVVAAAEAKARLQSECLYDTCGLLLHELSHLNLAERTLRAGLSAGQLERKISGDVDFSSKVREDVESRNVKKEERTQRPSDDDKALEVKLRDYHPDLQFPTTQSRFSDEYYNKSKIGEGKGGAVYQAIDRIEEKVYAIKRINLAHKSATEYRKLTKEVVQLSELYHEHIVRYYYAWTEEQTESDSSSEDSSEDDHSLTFLSSPVVEGRDSEDSESSADAPETLPQYLYVKMEFCEGDTVRAVLERESLPEAMERWRLFREILDALSYVHSKGIVHKNLKPANIFLDGSARVKLGGFGLARHRSRRDTEGEELEQFYWSPETEYSEKADLFSLGVIFYELWRPFRSASQRLEELKRLSADQSLPDDFVRSTPANVVEVVKMLTKTDPGERPNARTMLYSELLPHKFESHLVDDFIQTILNPKTSERKWLLEALFEQQTNPAEVDFSFSISKLAAVGTESSQEDNRRLVKMQSLVQSSIVNRFKGIFERAGAIHLIAPLVTPYFDFVKISDGKETLMVKTEAMSPSATVTFLESNGVLVSLPNRSILPWARLIARNNLGGVIKRYSVSPIFRPRERQEPIQNLEAAFDICCEERLSSRAQIQIEAEVIKVALDCLNCLGSEQHSFEVRVNSSRLVSEMVGMVQVPKHLRANVYGILSDCCNKKWVVTKSRLEKAGLTLGMLEKLAVFFRQRGSVSDLLVYFHSISSGSQMDRLVSELRHLERIIEACGALDIQQAQIVIDLSLISEGLLCFSGVMFKIYGRDRYATRLFAYGGRYDNLIQQFDLQDSERALFDKRPVRMAGVGLRIQLNQMVDFVLRLGEEPERQCLHGPRVCITSQMGEVRVERREEDLERMKERSEFCAELWKFHIPAIYFYSQVPEEQALDFCLRYKIHFLVFIKSAPDKQPDDNDLPEEDVKTKKDSPVSKPVQATATYRDLFTHKDYDSDLPASKLCEAIRDALRLGA